MASNQELLLLSRLFWIKPYQIDINAGLAGRSNAAADGGSDESVGYLLLASGDDSATSTERPPSAVGSSRRRRLHNRTPVLFVDFPSEQGVSWTIWTLTKVYRAGQKSGP